MTEAVDLATRDVEVLELVVESSGASVTTLREALWWAEKNQHVHYRLDKLEERGLIESWKDDETTTRGPLSPRRVAATDEGEELLGVIGDERAEGIEERLATVEKQVDVWGATHAEVKRRIVEAEGRIDELEAENRELGEELARVWDVVEDMRESSELATGFEFGDD